MNFYATFENERLQNKLCEWLKTNSKFNLKIKNKAFL